MTGQNSTPAPATAAKPGPKQPLVGVIYNRHSHRNQGLDHDSTDRPNILVAHPAGTADLAGLLAGFAQRGVELLVINGGDGTVRDVLTSGLPIWGDDWPALAVLPKGKTNALNVDLGAPADWSLADAIAAFERGNRVRRRALKIAGAETSPPSGAGSTKPPAMLGFILGAGAFTTGIRVGQDAHRMGAFNSLAVGATTAWGVVQSLFGTDRNRWRSGVGMQLHIGAEGNPLAHSGIGDPDKRWFLISSTLENLPVGMKPFGPYRTGLKLTVVDRPRRRLLAMIPAIVAGKVPQWVLRAGVHFVRTDRYDLALADEFILDGEAFPAGRYTVSNGPELCFVVP